MKFFELLVFSSEGELIPAVDLVEAMVVDREHLPRFRHKAQTSNGRLQLPVAPFPFGVCLRLPVKGFGDVWIYADNQGRGYDPSDCVQPLNFCIEAASSRIAAVSAGEADYRERGLTPSGPYTDRMETARALLAKAIDTDDTAAASMLAMESLAHSMHAGEMIVVEGARHDIALKGARKEFLFGCNGFKYPQLGEPYARKFNELFNFVTLPFYLGHTTKTEGQTDYACVDKILEWAQRDGLTTKGHPLVWFNEGIIPPWLEGRNFEDVRKAFEDYITQSVSRYRGRISIWDVINEAHDWANAFAYDEDQFLEMTRMACDTTRAADPDAIRIVNSCCTWGEYVARWYTSKQDLGRTPRSVLRYVRDVIAAGIDFEVIGLQMYYPSRDLFEINMHLDLFCALGKPIHITELGVSAANKPQTTKHHLQLNPHFWHGTPWSETQQADWIEGFYTICYAKPAIEAVSWWNFTDPAFVPQSGLAHEDLTPKEGYWRLLKLFKQWGAATAAMPQS
jgi:endo-1,4-beta-xylanase